LGLLGAGASCGYDVKHGRDRRRYEITEVGRARVTASMFTPGAPQPLLQSNLFTKT